MFNRFVEFVREIYRTNGDIPLHEPRFLGNEKKYLAECIDSTFVSSVGPFVSKFEKRIADYTGASYAVATVNGTAALHIALLVAGVKPDDEVITQPLTFVATANAIVYCGARPVFVDIDVDTLGLSPCHLREFIDNNVELRDDGCSYNVKTNRKISACVPMHTFGHPCRIDEIKRICDEYRIELIEDAAESLGSRYKSKHTGTFGKAGILSFNGNKIITTGGGGMIITDDESFAKKAKHLTTQAKIDHPWEYMHDEIGYNYRMPNINAALGLAQMEVIDNFIQRKRYLSEIYTDFFLNTNISFLNEPENSASNYWLNGICFPTKSERDSFLEYTNENGIMTRSPWRLLPKLTIFGHCTHSSGPSAEWAEDHLANIPSSVI